MSDSSQQYGNGTASWQLATVDDEDEVNRNGAPERSSQDDDDGEEDYTVEPAPILQAFDSEALGNVADEDNEPLTEAQVAQLLITSSDESADYYTLLGLSRESEPTDAQIRAAYHRLSLAFHPDKQPPYLKNAAESHFTRLRRAYETLIEPRKRVIYDLEGEEGVQEEYRQGGAMGPGGEAERQLSSAKAMKPNEFKKWFLGVMRGRERQALEAMIDHETSFHIGLDATGAFTESYKVVRDGDTEFTFPLEPIRLQEIGVNSGFSVPLPRLGRLLETQIPSIKELFGRSVRTAEEEEEDESTPQWTDSLSPTNPRLTLTGGIHGDLDQGYAILESIHEKSTGIEIPIRDRFYTMDTQNISLGASISHTFPDLLDAPPNTIASALQGFNFDAEANILPHPANFTLGLGKAISFASDVRPFYVATKVIVRDAVSSVPPEVQVTLTRNLGVKGDKTAFLMWQSGERQWSPFWQSVLKGNAPASSIVLDYVARWQTMGKAVAIMRMGMVFQHRPESTDPTDAEGAQSLEAGNTTRVSITAQQAGALSMELTHSFDLFSRYTAPPIRSQILNSGDAAAPATASSKSVKSRGVNVEVAASLSLPVNLNATLTGKRRFGNFTTVGLGVGLNPSLGLHFSISWERLGQSIAVPVVLLPLESTTTESILMAVGIPWATYTAVEFLLLRPRAASKRQRLIKQQRRKLRADINKRREEAEQAVELMTPSVSYRQSIEAAHDGLVIQGATYGVRGKDGRWKESQAIDVTTAMAALVDDGQLSLARGLDKSRLIGFWDPSPLERKCLIVYYLFGGKKHRVEVMGGKGMVLPRREHEVSR